MNSHRDLDLCKPVTFVGTLLVPQPGGSFDCCENSSGTEFTFFTGNGMEGHTRVYGPISAPDPRLVPEYNWQLKLWTWQHRTQPTTDEWWENRK